MTPGLRDVLAFSWRHWRRRPWILAVLALGIGGKMLAEISVPVFIGQMIDALTAVDYETALMALGVILTLRLVFVILHNGGDYVWTFLAIRILRQICADAFARVQRYSAEWHGNTFAGSTVRKITRGFWAFDQLGDSMYFHLIPSVAVVLGVLITMTIRWPEMAALFAIGCAVYCWVSIHMTMAYFAPRRRAAVTYDTKLGGALADAVTCNALVKSSGAEQREDHRLEGILDHWQRTHIRCWRAGIDTGVAQSVTMLIVQAVLLGGQPLALAAGPGERWRCRLCPHQFHAGERLSARCRPAYPGSAACGQRSGGRGRIHPDHARGSRSVGGRQPCRATWRDQVRSGAVLLPEEPGCRCSMIFP